VDDVHVPWGRARAAGAAIVALAAPAAAMAGSAGAAGPGTPATGHVVLVGIGGLRWSDVSSTATPALWRLAGEGSPGSLVVSGIDPRTRPAPRRPPPDPPPPAAPPPPPAG